MDGMENVAMDDMATIIIIRGLTIPGSTAAWPITSPPTIPMVVPIGPESLVADSLRRSMVNSIINASKGQERVHYPACAK